MTKKEKAICKAVSEARKVRVDPDPDLASAGAFFREQREKKARIARHTKKIMELRNV
jgi:hypothetical protein